MLCAYSTSAQGLSRKAVERDAVTGGVLHERVRDDDEIAAQPRAQK
jgi:hypothetical protein